MLKKVLIRAKVSFQITMSQVSASNPKKSRNRHRRKKSGKTSEVVGASELSDMLSSELPTPTDPSVPYLSDLVSLKDETEPMDELEDPVTDPMIRSLIGQLEAIGGGGGGPTSHPAANGKTDPEPVTDVSPQQVSPIHQLVGAMSLDLVEARQFEEERERISRQGNE